MYSFLFALDIACVAIGASSTVINDLFFILSSKKHIIKDHEVRIVKRLNLAAIISSGIILLAELAMLLLQARSGIFQDEENAYAKIVVVAIIFMALAALRNVHLPALLRSQRQHGHLSESFFLHHDSLVATTAVSLVSWIFLVFVFILQDQYLMGVDLSYFILIYMAVLFLAIKCSLFLKKL